MRHPVVADFYQKSLAHGKQYTLQHFAKMGHKKRSIYRVMQRVDAGESVERRKGQGHPHALSKATEWKVKLAVNNKDGASIVTLALALICIFPFSGCQHIIFFLIFLFLLTNHTCML